MFVLEIGIVWFLMAAVFGCLLGRIFRSCDLPPHPARRTAEMLSFPRLSEAAQRSLR